MPTLGPFAPHNGAGVGVLVAGWISPRRLHLKGGVPLVCISGVLTGNEMTASMHVVVVVVIVTRER